MRSALPLAFLCLAPLCFADRYQFIEFGPNLGQPILGSEDGRHGYFVGVGEARPDKRLTWHGQTAYLMTELYYLNTTGGGFDQYPTNRLHTYGMLFSARYDSHFVKNNHTFLDLGLGLCYNDHTTSDLDTRINSTPWIAVGIVLDSGPFKGELKIRFMHISNAGTDLPNRGSNNIQLLFGSRF